MISLCRELKKIVNQLRGSENIFGYQSTAANQLYLLYCFCGKMYFSNKVDKRVRYFWCIIASCQVLFSYVIGLAYLWFDEKNDLVLMLNVAVSVGGVQVTVLGFFFISYLCSDQIEAMIKHVDKISTIEPDCHFKQKKIMADAKEYLSLLFVPLFFCLFVYLSACVLDVVLFFQDEKVKNYFYYAYPPPLIQNYSSFKSFVIVTGITSIMFGLVLLETLAIFGLVLYWNIICSDELIFLANGFRARMCDLTTYTGEEIKTADWNEEFEYALEHCAKEFQGIIRLINYLRGFVEAMASIIIMGAFGYGVALLYVCSSNDLPLALIVKYSSGCVSNGVTVFLFYWVGQNLNNSVSEVSLAVYSAPWYQSVRIRKNVYILLCQTQSMKNFTAIKVIGLLLNNFSRYLNVQVSYTNILRRLTRK